MKKLLFTVTLLAFTTLIDVGFTSSQNKANAQVGPKEIATVLEAVVDLFCPETPQNRCKNGYCQTGACISFRKACPPDKLGQPC